MMIIVVIKIMGIMIQHTLLIMLNMKTFIYLITITFKSNEKFEATVIKQIKNLVSIIKISCQNRCMTYKIIPMMTMSIVLMMNIKMLICKYINIYKMCK